MLFVLILNIKCIGLQRGSLLILLHCTVNTGHRVQCGAVNCSGWLHCTVHCSEHCTVYTECGALHCSGVQLLFGCCKSPAPSPVACVGLLNTKTNLLLSIIIISAGKGRCQTQKYQRSEIATLPPDQKTSTFFFITQPQLRWGRALAKPLARGWGHNPCRQMLSLSETHCMLCKRNSCQFRATRVTLWHWGE